MHTLVSTLVALSVEKYYMDLMEIQLKYVAFMAPLAKKVSDPWNRLMMNVIVKWRSI